MSYYPNLTVAVQTNASEGKKVWIMRVTRIYLLVSSPYKSNANDPVSPVIFSPFSSHDFFAMQLPNSQAFFAMQLPNSQAFVKK